MYKYCVDSRSRYLNGKVCDIQDTSTRCDISYIILVRVYVRYCKIYTNALCSGTTSYQIAISILALAINKILRPEQKSGMWLILAENKSRSTYFEVQSWPKKGRELGKNKNHRKNHDKK